MASPHAALQAGRVAVITGGSSGIGLATAVRCASWGMKVCLADVDAPGLDTAVEKVVQAATGGADTVMKCLTDVSKREDLEALKDAVYGKWGEVGFLFNNAGIGGGAAVLGERTKWDTMLGVNMYGVLNGVQVFVPSMVEQKTPCIVVNTGSKQGITTPPGDAAYNVSKAGVKVITEGLQHELRNTEGCQVSVHLLIPGWVNTAIAFKARRRLAGDAFDPTTVPFSEEKPAGGAWMPNQVVDFMMDAVQANRFYIICPDNDMSAEKFRRAVQWNADDIIQEREALSRWTAEGNVAFAAATEGV